MLDQLGRELYRLADLPPLGIAPLELDGIEVRAYGAAKAVADCFKHGNDFRLDVPWRR